MSAPLLTATYTSPTNAPFTFSSPSPLPTLSSTTAPGVSEKTAYLAALRTQTASMQEFINKELTQRMEGDKAAESAAAGAGKKSLVDEAKEEENYGEEVVEEE